MKFCLWRSKNSVAVCKSDWHNVRSYLFFNVCTFRTKLTLFCAMTLTQEYTFLVRILLWLAEHFYQYSLYWYLCALSVWSLDYCDHVVKVIWGPEKKDPLDPSTLLNEVNALWHFLFASQSCPGGPPALHLLYVSLIEHTWFHSSAHW